MSDQRNNDINSNVEYNECCLSSVADCCSGKICRVKKDWPNHCVDINQLQNNVVNYLVAVKVINKQHQHLYTITENQLLLNRLSRIIDIEKPNLKICPTHRFIHGIGWSIPKSCVYFKEGTVLCHSRSDRVAPIHLIQSISTFPYGGKICSKHRNELYNNDIQTSTIIDEVSGVHSWEIGATNQNMANEALFMSEQSRIKSQARRIPILDQAPGSQRRLISKLRKTLASQAISIANSIVPGEAETLIELAGLNNVISTQSSSITSTSDDQLIKRMIEVYKALEQKKYPFIERVQLLAILPESMSNKEIMERFGCSSHAIKTARKLQLATTTPTHQVESPTIVRNRINPLLTDHFLSWLINTNMLTTIAWGATKIRLDRGDVLEIPKQVLQGKKSHIIHQYQTHCEEMSMDLLSERTLRYILDSINVTEQEALSGIDDIVKDAREGWIAIEELLPSLLLSKEDRNSVLTTIKQNKLYLKTLFINHCYEEQLKTCPTHCLVYALSQGGNGYYAETCDHDHNKLCQDCASIIGTLDFIDKQIDRIVNNEEKDEIRYDFQKARESIIELFRHLIRAVQQDSVKTEMLCHLDEETAFLTIDWTQKILQQKYREGQSEYFAKRGMSLLVASFTFKDLARSKQGQFITKTYMLALNRCSQNELDTLSGGFILLQQFIAEHQHIKKLIKRSDNASVLGGHATFETEQIFCDQAGIQILVRDYSEIQRGKSVCDRMAGAAKLRMRAWINAGNDLLNASDIKKGMEYCGGVKNVKIGVAELISNQIKVGDRVSVPEVSLIRSVVYTDDGMIIRKASNIGRGRLIPYSKIQVKCNMKLIESFSPSNQQSNTTEQNERLDRKINKFYFCPQYNCISTFKNEADLYDHIALDQHLTTDDKMTTFDVAKVQLFHNLRDANLSLQTTQPTTTSSYTTMKPLNILNTSQTMKYFSYQGWALKVPKPYHRISDDIKLFIKSILHEEKLYSVKFSEKDFVRRIRTARRSDGTKMFSPEQYLTVSQVKTQIKLLSKQLSTDGSETNENSAQFASVDDDEDENQYKKTPRQSRKQISIRTSTRKPSSAQSSHASNDYTFNQRTSDGDLDEEDEMAIEQEKQMDALKKKILTPRLIL